MTEDSLEQSIVFGTNHQDFNFPSDTKTRKGCGLGYLFTWEHVKKILETYCSHLIPEALENK